MRFVSSVSVFVLMLLGFSCSKDSPKPLEISIAAVKDSLMRLPIAFSAKTSETPDSYLWDFGDGTTSQEASPQHTYQNMGSFNVTCKAMLRGILYTAGYIMKVKGDPRLVGQKHFSGTFTYSTSFDQTANPTNFVTRPVSDTILTFTAPREFTLVFWGKLEELWAHDTNGEVQYQYQTTLSHGSEFTYLRYYQANDSTFVYYRRNGYGIDPTTEWTLHTK